jgi:hypothetical protein
VPIVRLAILISVYFSGVMNIVSAVHEGLYNAPKLYGSEVREQGKVTDFGSGMKEAGKASFLMVAVLKHVDRFSPGFLLWLLRWHHRSRS